jgi:hypothetical protein
MTADTAMTDQIQAACRDAQSIVETVLARPGGMIGVPGPFLASLAESIAAADLAGVLRRCRHLRGRGPEPVWAMAWQPGRIMCAVCALDALRAVQRTAEDRTCDVCRILQLDGKLWSGIGSAGPIVLTFGVCAACSEAEIGVAL